MSMKPHTPEDIRAQEDHNEEKDGPFWSKWSFWVILTSKDEKGVRTDRIAHVYDVMRCIHGPGDYGWVSPVDGKGLEAVADFEQCFSTQEEAAQALIAMLERQKAALDVRLLAARALIPDPNLCTHCGHRENLHSNGRACQLVNCTCRRFRKLLTIA